MTHAWWLAPLGVSYLEIVQDIYRMYTAYLHTVCFVLLWLHVDFAAPRISFVDFLYI